ncbi:pmpB, partial [Symbiodinium pilosum]
LLPLPLDASALLTTYWICSFANNQWDIEIELGETIEDSPFAKVLCGNIRGVVMILDSDVLPLTRSWCLLEYYMTTRVNHLQVCFAVDRGVLSDMTCTSFTTALRAAERLRALCFRSSDAAKNEDKERILRYVASTIGLEVAEQDITETLSQALHSSIKQLELVTAERSSRLCDEASQQRELVMQETF